MPSKRPPRGLHEPPPFPKPAHSGFNERRAVANARLAWCDPLDGRKFTPSEGGDTPAHLQIFATNTVTNPNADATQTTGAPQSLAVSVIDPLQKIQRDCLLNGDLPRAAGAAALLLNASRALAPGQNAETAAVAQHRLYKLGHPDSRRRKEYQHAERAGFSVAAECARVPRVITGTTTNDVRKTSKASTSKASTSKTPKTKNLIANCFAAADETKTREFCNDVAVRGSHEDQLDALELVVSHLTGPTTSTRNVDRALIEANRRVKLGVQRGGRLNTLALRIQTKISYARRRADALVSFGQWCGFVGKGVTGNASKGVRPTGVTDRTTSKVVTSNDTTGKQSKDVTRSFVASFFVDSFSKPDEPKNENSGKVQSTKANDDFHKKEKRLKETAKGSLYKLLEESACTDFGVVTSLVRIMLHEKDVLQALELLKTVIQENPHDADAAAAYAELCAIIRHPENEFANNSACGSSSSSSSNSDSSDSDGSSSSDDDASPSKSRSKSNLSMSHEAKKNRRDARSAAKVVTLTQNFIRPSAVVTAISALNAVRANPGSAENLKNLIVALDDLTDSERLLEVREPGLVKPTWVDLMEALAVRCETTSRDPGAWWALTRALVGFRPEERLTERSVEADVALKALSQRNIKRRSTCVVAAKDARRVFFSSDANSNKSRIEWWPKLLLARDLLGIGGAGADDGDDDDADHDGDGMSDGIRIHADDGDATRAKKSKHPTRAKISPLPPHHAALLSAQAACSQVLFPNDGFHVLASRRLNALTNPQEFWNSGKSKKSLNKGRGGFHGEWKRRGKKALGKSFYDETVRANARVLRLSVANGVTPLLENGNEGNDLQVQAAYNSDQSLSLSLSEVSDTAGDPAERELNAVDTVETDAQLSSKKRVRAARAQILRVKKKRRDGVREDEGEKTKAAAECDDARNQAVEIFSSKQKKRKHPRHDDDEDDDEDSEGPPVPVFTKKTGKRKDPNTGGTVTSKSKTSKPNIEDKRCKACFFAARSKKKCGVSGQAPSFCFLV